MVKTYEPQPILLYQICRPDVKKNLKKWALTILEWGRNCNELRVESSLIVNFFGKLILTTIKERFTPIR